MYCVLFFLSTMAKLPAALRYPKQPLECVSVGRIKPAIVLVQVSRKNDRPKHWVVVVVVGEVTSDNGACIPKVMSDSQPYGTPDTLAELCRLKIGGDACSLCLGH